jgi:hypothetical protein
VSEESLSFAARIGLAFAAFFRVLGDGVFAARVRFVQTSAPRLPPPAEPTPVKTEPKLEAADTRAALQLLALFQREGRLVDFLMDDVAAFSDAEIGAAARVVHAGARKLLLERVTITPVRTEAEGDRVDVPSGYDASAVRVIGNVKGEPPYVGTLVHKGWRASGLTLPTLHADHDPSVIAPAEVELS